MTYKQLHELFLKAKNKTKGKPIARNTRVVRVITDTNGIPIYGILYHNTIICRWYNTGEIQLNNGGYYTVSTKERMNRYIREHGHSIHQKNHVWYITNIHTGITNLYENGETVNETTI